MSISNQSIFNESSFNESSADELISDQSSADGTNEQCHADDCGYTVSIKLNIPIQVEPQVFTKAASFCTNQKFQIRIQPDIQISPEVKASITNCVTQGAGDRSDSYFPELIVEGLFEDS
ncbi:MAG TPA: hypothetical protein V6C65_21070 [Allocoleopsis sp.]